MQGYESGQKFDQKDNIAVWPNSYNASLRFKKRNKKSYFDLERSGISSKNEGRKGELKDHKVENNLVEKYEESNFYQKHVTEKRPKTAEKERRYSKEKNLSFLADSKILSQLQRSPLHNLDK